MPFHRAQGRSVSFFLMWCTHLEEIHNSAERDQAFVGLFRAVKANPNVCVPEFHALITAVASGRKELPWVPVKTEDDTTAAAECRDVRPACVDDLNALTTCPTF